MSGSYKTGSISSCTNYEFRYLIIFSLTLSMIVGLSACSSSSETTPTQKANPPTSEKEINSASNDKENSDTTSAGSEDATGDDKLSEEERLKRQREALMFFNESVIPAFETTCKACHADPRESPIIQGPQSIYGYSSMKSWLTEGNSMLNNKLMQKVTNAITHQGGDQCNGNVEAGPCSIIIAWWKKEFGESSESVDGFGNLGKIDEVDATGDVYGYAGSKNDPAAVAEINLYVGGPKGSGTLIATFDADQNGYAGGIPGNHAFKFKLPEAQRDGTSKVLHAYGKIDGVEFELGGSPYTFVAYTSTQAGQNYFASDVQPALNNTCSNGSCHASGFAYNGAYYRLITPSPAAGGTASNNGIINRANGLLNHPRNICDRVSGGAPCSQLRTWWGLEFN